jgi:hypothetical protein
MLLPGIMATTADLSGNNSWDVLAMSNEILLFGKILSILALPQ